MIESASKECSFVLMEVKRQNSIDICEFLKKQGYTIKELDLETTGICLHTDNRVKLIEGSVK